MVRTFSYPSYRLRLSGRPLSRKRLTLLSFVSLMAGLALAAAGRADEPPPDRLQKKPRPAEPKPADPPPTPMKPADEPKDEPDKPAEDPAKLRDEIAADMQSAEKKLKDRDPGRDTQQLQDRALRNIDKLLDLARNPPPPPPQQQQPMSGDPPPMGGEQPQGGQPQSQPGSQSQPGTQQRPQTGLTRKERREQRRQQAGQQARGGQQPRPQPGGSQPQQAGLKSQPQDGMQPGNAQPPVPGRADGMADVAKDIWGHLPETLRQEVDHYYRDRFMPRYRDLLREYYGRLAERDRARRGDQP